MSMRLPTHVKSKPSLPTFLKRIPLFDMLFCKTAQGIYPYIFVPREIYTNLQSSKPDPYHISLIVHEQTHLNRQKKLGWLIWITTYIFNPNFRFNEELAANIEQMIYMKKNNLSFPFEMKAKMLSSWIYLKPVSYEVALLRLKCAWLEL